MVDKALFMETLRSVQELAKASPKPMAREELEGYFKDLELTAEQQELVYQYFQKPQEEPEAEMPSQPQAGSRKETAHSQHFQMYLNEIKSITDLSAEGKTELYQSLLAGEKSAVSAILSQWLEKIAELAGAYASGQVLVEDLVQEGNMGLLLGLEELLGAGEQYQELAADSSAMERKLESYIREAMGQYRQETEGISHGEHTILAKVNLVHEAQKVLAEENGTIPALQELSDYTRIPMEEVRDIMALFRKKGERS